MVSICVQRVRRAFLLAVLALMATAAPAVTSPAGASADCTSAGAASSPDDLAEAARTVRCLVNAERQAHGLVPVRPSKELERAASGHSQAMLATATFEHRVAGEPPLRARVRGAGYLRRAARWWLGETLAYGSGGYRTPASLVDALMASPPHREIILDPQFRQVGVGLLPGLPIPGDAAPDGVTLTLNFGRIATR